MNATAVLESRARRLRPLLMALVALTPIACGSAGPSMAKVSGRVTYQGKPVTKGTISFVTVDEGGRNATGEIGPDGSYSLQTEEPGDGARIGGYDVVISSREDAILDYIPKVPVPPKFLVPQKYSSPQTSGLKRAVVKGGNTINFDLTD